jgi:hypothetical protein
MIFVFLLQGVLLIFAFCHRQEISFEAPQRSKDASHASTARKLILKAVHTSRMAAAAVLGSPSSNHLLKDKTQNEEKRKRKREKKQKRKR